MRKFLVMAIFMLIGLNVNADNVNIKDIIGNWKFVRNEGVVMVGDIVMNISATTISQSLYMERSGTKTEMFNAIYYLSDAPATSWNNDMVGKVQSGSYMIRNSNGKISQVKMSFNSEGLLVVEPYGDENGMTMQFRKMTAEETSRTDKYYLDESMNLMKGFITIHNRELDNPLLIIEEHGDLISQIACLIDQHDTKDMTTLRIGGPLNGIDLSMLRSVADDKEYFPKLNTLDLSMAWFVTDSVPYEAHDFRNCDHRYFDSVHGLHMLKNINKDSIGGVYYLETDTSINVCYDKYGWLLEMEKDSAYAHLCTTIDDCISELSFNELPWLEHIILPHSTKEIHWQAFAYCPNLKEITIPASVTKIGDAVFAGDSALTVVRVAEDSKILHKLMEDLKSEDPSIFYGHNPNLKIETYSTQKPNVTFNIRGKKYSSKRRISVYDHYSGKQLKTLEPDTQEFSFEVTAPQYSLISIGSRDKSVIAEGGDVYIDLVNDSLSGTPLNDKLHRYKKILEQKDSEVRVAKGLLETLVCEDSVHVFKARVDSARVDFNRSLYDIFLSNYANTISAYILYRYYGNLPISLSRALLLICDPEIAASPLLRNEWEMAKESSRTVDLDFYGYSDPKFMTYLKSDNAGSLRTLLDDDKWTGVSRLRIEGPINVSDIRWLNSMCKSGLKINGKPCRLRALDLSDAYIVDEQGKVSTYMPDSAFSGSFFLNYIALPKNITVIGNRCFLKNNIRFVKMYDKVHTIKNEAFGSSLSLSDIELPACLESIGEDAFFLCRNLRKMILPNKVKEIGDGAFRNCMNLLKLHIPASTKFIGKRLTAASENVTITVDKGNKDYKEISNVIIACTDEARKAIGQTMGQYFKHPAHNRYKVRYKMVNGKQVEVSRTLIK